MQNFVNLMPLHFPKKGMRFMTPKILPVAIAAKLCTLTTHLSLQHSCAMCSQTRLIRKVLPHVVKKCRSIALLFDKRNLVAIRKSQHVVSSIDPPTCKYCLQTVPRSNIKRWMARNCACAPDPSTLVDGAKITKRITGKQSAPLLRLPPDAS